MTPVVKSFETINYSENEHYENDFLYDIELNRLLLKLVGIWPAKSPISKIISRLVIVASFAFLLIFLFPQSFYFFLIEDSAARRCREFGPLSFTAMAIARYSIILLKREGLESCINILSKDWRRADSIRRPIMLRYSATSRLFTKLYILAVFGSIGFFTWVLPFMGPKDIGNQTMRPLPYPAEFFIFDIQKSPMYEIVFITHSISMLGVVCTTTCGIYTMTVKLVAHACAQFEIVLALIESIDEDRLGGSEKIIEKTSVHMESFVQRRIGEIVQQHLHVLALVSQMEAVLNEICLIDMIGYTLNICIIGYDLLTEWRTCGPIGLLTFSMLGCSMVTNIFVICYVGEHLSELCEKVGVASYTTNWWILTKHQTRALILVIATSHIPVKFTAGKMSTLSLQTFGAVMKASMAYLNALRAVTASERDD